MPRRRRRPRTPLTPQPTIFVYMAQWLQGALLACGVLLSHGGPSMSLEAMLLILLAAGGQWVYLCHRYQIGPWTRNPSEGLFEAYDHLSRGERREFRTREASLYHWSVLAESLTVICIAGIMMSLPIEYALLALVLLPIASVAYARYWRRTQIDWLCKTTWAREQGIQPDALQP